MYYTRLRRQTAQASKWERLIKKMVVQLFVRIYGYKFKNKYVLYKPTNWNVANHLSKSLFVRFFNHASLTSSVSKSIKFATSYVIYIYMNVFTISNLKFQ